MMRRGLLDRPHRLEAADDDAAERVGLHLADADLAREVADGVGEQVVVVHPASERADLVPAIAVERGVQRRGVFDVELAEPFAVLVDVDVEAEVGHDAALVERVLAGVTQRHELGVLGQPVGDRGELEAGDPAHQGGGRVVRPLEIGEQLVELPSARYPVEPAEADVHRMDRASAHDLQDPVAGLLEVQHLGHQLRFVPGDRDPGVDTEEVGGVQEGHVQHVALDPFAAVEQAPQLADRSVDRDAGEAFHGVGRGHLVGDRADPADPRRDVDRLVVRPAAEERFEQARRLVDLELDVVDDAVSHDNVHGALALDAGERRDVEVDRLVRHGRAPSDVRRAKASTSNVRIRRSMAVGSTPS